MMTSLLSTGQTNRQMAVNVSLQSLEDMETSALRFLPVLLNELFHLLCNSAETIQHVKPDILK